MASSVVELAGPAGVLEAILHEPVGEPRALAVVCHPHPLQQGTMHNKVTVTLGRSFEKLDCATLRFNFRGVGKSAGRYGDGIGEQDDTAAAVEWMRGRWPGLPLHLAGFSFGAMIAIRVAAPLAVRSLVSVAPAVERLQHPFPPPRCPWLIVQGESDDVVSATAVTRWAAELDPSPPVVLLPEVGHFFHRRLRELEGAVRQFLISLDEFAEVSDAEGTH